MPDVKILIAMPVHDGNVAIECMFSVLELTRALNAEGIDTDFKFRVATDIARQRNWLASFVLRDEDYTHLLFVDNDMIFRPEAALGLIRSGHDVCGCLYAMRSMDLRKFHEVSKRGVGIDDALGGSQPFSGASMIGMEYVGGQWQYALREGFVPTRHIGCGITLISRRALLTMKAKLPNIASVSAEPFYTEGRDPLEIIRCFDHVARDDGVLLSEDLSFCHRWTNECGGMIWASIEHDIGHVGRFIYGGTASAYLRQNPPRG